MPYTERSAPQVILNKMTKAQFDSIEKDQNQLYAITDMETANERELTQAEYNALSEAEKNNGTTYYITDAGTSNAGKILKNSVDYSGTRPAQIITAKMNNASDTTYSIAGTLPLTIINTQVGSSFELSSNAIVVGQNVGYVKISASVFYHGIGGGSAYGWFEIRKNNVSVGTSSIANIVSSSFATASMSDFVVQVSQGDKITIYNREPNTQIRGSNTWITVEAVGEFPSSGDKIVESYSTTEAMTGATWIDGKPIYKKTIDCGNLVNNDVKRVNHNITGLKQVIKMESTMYSGADAWILPYPYADRISLEGSQILINVPGNLASYKAHVTVFYTKN